MRISEGVQTGALPSSGILRVARDGEEGYRMTLPAYGPEPRPLPDIVKAVGGTPAETLWHPGRYALLVYASAADVRALAPDMAALRALGNVQAIATDRKSTRLNSSQ